MNTAREPYSPAFYNRIRRTAATLETDHPLAATPHRELHRQYLDAVYSYADSFTRAEVRQGVLNGWSQRVPSTDNTHPRDATAEELRTATVACICSMKWRDPNNHIFFSAWLKAAQEVVADRPLNTVSDRSAQVPA